jgi:predicted nucleic acid-binding protein
VGGRSTSRGSGDRPITLGAFRYGIERLPLGSKRSSLLEWFESSFPEQFSGRIVALDQHAADAWGALRAAGDAMGRPLPLVDGLLLAMAQVNSLTFVTRNESDVVGRGVPVLNPY